ncbi:MAG TPA: 5-oxoprolinase subunit PxpB [Stellaceae bacterium]|nr:5-oxoprolinase subunit PxpB [Stellaceae bacterium]
MSPRFLSAGDRALVVEFGARVDRSLSGAVLRLAASLRRAPPRGIVETVPTFRSLTVYYDPLATSRAKLEEAIRDHIVREEEPRRAATLWHVPVCYEGACAPDLPEVAGRLGLAPARVVALHSGVRYHIYMLGFLPGFPYLGDMPDALALPRRADPRLSVPAGSISIALTLTAIYPYESPGGWHLIGTTPIRLFDAARAQPALFAPGDAVCFEPIAPARFAAIRAAVAAGDYEVAHETVAL